jgi:heat shock protein HslJ
MKKAIYYLATILILLAISGCGIIPGGAEADLDGTAWSLISYGGTNVISGTNMTAKFNQSEINGSTGCNTYFGSYQSKGDQLTIKEMGWTEMACMDPEGVMEQEMDIMSLLSKTVSFEIEGETLRLQTEGGEELVFSSVDLDN